MMRRTIDTMANKNITKLCDELYAKYMNIDNETDLRREKLTQSEYTALREHLKDFFKNHKTVTMISGIAEWFKRNGCKVTYGYNVVNYLIEI